MPSTVCDASGLASPVILRLAMSFIEAAMNGVSKVLSIDLVVYSIPSTVSPVIFLDHLAAIAFARVIDSLNPRPLIISLLYATYQDRSSRICAQGSGPETPSREQLLLHRLTPSILLPLHTRDGHGLYSIDCSSVLLYLGRESLEWEVMYQPAEVFLQTRQAVLELQSDYHSFAAPVVPAIQRDPIRQSASAYANLSMGDSLYPVNSFTPAIELAMEGLDVYSAFNTPVVASQSEQGQQISPQPEPIEAASSQPEPELVPVIQQKTPLQADLDALLREMDGQICTPRQPKPFIPTSDFAIFDREEKEDKIAAEHIVSMFKVMAKNLSYSSDRRDYPFSIAKERQAIRCMSIDTSLNIDTQQRTPSQKLKQLFVKYDRPDEKHGESFQKALLMVAVRLMRQAFVNESGKKRPGNYAADFDSMYDFPPRYMRQAGRLCQLIVACGHPCIVLVIVRLAIRNGTKLCKLLDELPISHLSRFVATGKITDINLAPVSTTTPHRDPSLHDDLQWLHGNVFLPLVYEASRRIPAQLHLVEGSLICDQDSCLRATVHPTQQNRYSDFLAGHFHDQDFTRGRVLLDVSNVEKQARKEYSIEKHSRTFQQHTNAAAYAQIEHFPDPPQFLRTRTLSLSAD